LELSLGTRWPVPGNWLVDVELNQLWADEGNLGRPWDEPWMAADVSLSSGYSETCPSGIVPKEASLECNLTRSWTRYHWVGIAGGWTRPNNQGHTAREKSTSLGIDLVFN